MKTRARFREEVKQQVLVTPNDIWKYIFQIIVNGNDISVIVPLELVCHRWSDCLSTAITEATIFKLESFKCFLPLHSVRSLNIQAAGVFSKEVFQSFTRLTSLTLGGYFCVDDDVTHEMWEQMTNLKVLDLSRLEIGAVDEDCSNFIFDEHLGYLTNLETLRLGSTLYQVNYSNIIELTHLKEFDISRDDYTDFIEEGEMEFRYGIDFEALDHLKELKIMKIRDDYVEINRQKLQDKYPHVRFLWCWGADNILFSYEGPFSEAIRDMEKDFSLPGM